MATIVANFGIAIRSGINPGYTIHIDVGKLKIERNVRSRRKLVIEEADITGTIKPIPCRRIGRKIVDCSKFLLEQLKQKLEAARQSQDVVATQFLAFKLKKRARQQVLRLVSVVEKVGVIKKN